MWCRRAAPVRSNLTVLNGAILSRRTRAMFLITTTMKMDVNRSYIKWLEWWNRTRKYASSLTNSIINLICYKRSTNKLIQDRICTNMFQSLSMTKPLCEIYFSQRIINPSDRARNLRLENWTCPRYLDINHDSNTSSKSVSDLSVTLSCWDSSSMINIRAGCLDQRPGISNILLSKIRWFGSIVWSCFVALTWKIVVIDLCPQDSTICDAMTSHNAEDNFCEIIPFPGLSWQPYVVIIKYLCLTKIVLYAKLAGVLYAIIIVSVILAYLLTIVTLMCLRIERQMCTNISMIMRNFDDIIWLPKKPQLEHNYSNYDIALPKHQNFEISIPNVGCTCNTANKHTRCLRTPRLDPQIQ